MNVTEKQFNQFRKLVYHECGINLHDGKQQLLAARLAKRLRVTGISNVDEYLRILESDSRELINFLDAISTNHTFFFRESHHFTVLADGHKKIWCAASSSGEEPYSIAMDCLEKGFAPEILATDISTKVLRLAQQGVYPMERAKNVAPNVLKRYFQKGTGKWEGCIRVKDRLRQMVRYQRFNLLSDPLPNREFDIVFCRNVLIYFDNTVKTEVVNKLYKAVKPMGFFIIGGAESLNNIQHGFKYLRPSIYQKVR
jgi:chemotaxis protein methyltransferase CheR